VLLLGIKWLTQRLAPIFSLWLKDEWMECEREDERNSFLKNEMPFRSWEWENVQKRWGGPFIPPHIELPLVCQKLGLVNPMVGLVQTKSFWIQMVMDRLTQTSPDRGRTSPAKAEPSFWLTQTSLDKGRTSLNNPSCVNLDNPDLSGLVRIGPG
jgi:hypothetical protein